MDFFIKKIFDGKCEGDDLVHQQFIKFSRGEFANKAMFVAKKQKDKYSISTTADYANELVRFMAEKLGENTTTVTGLIVSTRDLTGEIEFSDKSQFQGIKKYKISKEMTGTEILEICNKFPSSFIAFTFKANNSELKIKEKLPKSGKPSKKSNEKPAADFCKLKTDEKDIIESMIFESEALVAKDVYCDHTFQITDIVMPNDEELASAGVDKNDFSKIREMAKRKGKIIRNLTIDGEKSKKEVDFIA